ncbi:hypothetical protein [Nocardia sp. NPDC004722]
MSSPQGGNPDEAFFKDLASAFVEAGGEGAPGIDIVSHPGPGAVVDEKQTAERARELTHQIARELATDGPEGWERIDAIFAWTVAAQTWNVTYSANGRAVRAEPSQTTLLAVQEQRETAAELPAGPWWRMRLIVTNSGEVQTDYDYGGEPFPDDQLFPAEAYRADLEQYPRDRLPVWLAAYVGNEGKQQPMRSEASSVRRVSLKCLIPAEVNA